MIRLLWGGTGAVSQRPPGTYTPKTADLCNSHVHCCIPSILLSTTLLASSVPTACAVEVCVPGSPASSVAHLLQPLTTAHPPTAPTLAVCTAAAAIHPGLSASHLLRQYQLLPVAKPVSATLELCPRHTGARHQVSTSCACEGAMLVQPAASWQLATIPTRHTPGGLRDPICTVPCTSPVLTSRCMCTCLVPVLQAVGGGAACCRSQHNSSRSRCWPAGSHPANQQSLPAIWLAGQHPGSS